jgi:hypothetical protein
MFMKQLALIFIVLFTWEASKGATGYRLSLESNRNVKSCHYSARPRAEIDIPAPVTFPGTGTVYHMLCSCDSEFLQAALADSGGISATITAYNKAGISAASAPATAIIK